MMNERIIMLTLFGALTAAGCKSASIPATPLYAERIGTGHRAVVVLPGLLGSTRYREGSGIDQLTGSYTVLYVDPLGADMKSVVRQRGYELAESDEATPGAAAPTPAIAPVPPPPGSPGMRRDPLSSIQRDRP